MATRRGLGYAIILTIATAGAAGLAATQAAGFIGARALTLRGAWKLPEGPGQSGFASGTVSAAPCSPSQLELDAALFEEISTELHSRSGRFDGVLRSGATGWIVRGDWQAGFFSGSGRWWATVYRPLGPALIPVGELSGRFEDAAGYDGSSGAFDGVGVVCR